MKSCGKPFCFLVLILMGLLLLSGCSPIDKTQVNMGTAAFADSQLQSGSVFTLRGQWRIAWGEWLDPKMSWNEVMDKTQGISIPQVYKENPVYSETPLSGYGTLAVRITVPHSGVTRYGLETAYIASAYRMYGNGYQMAASGVPAKDTRTTLGQIEPQSGFVADDRGEIRIIVHFSNLNTETLSLRDVLFGLEKDINHHKRLRLASDMGVIGAVFFMGLYHLFLFVLRQKDRSLLYFASICFVYTARTSMVGDRFIYTLFPNLDFDSFMRPAYISIYVMPLLILLFLHEVFPQYAKRWMLQLSQVITALIVFGAVVLDPADFDVLLLPFGLVAMVQTVYMIWFVGNCAHHRRPGGRILLLGLMAFLGTGVNDLLYEWGVLQTTSLTPYGLLFLLGAQSLMLANNYSNAFDQSEVLADRIKEMNRFLIQQNESLEEQVLARTSEIEMGKQALEHANDQLKTMIGVARENEENFRSLFNNMSIGVFRYRDSAGFTMINPKVADILGYSDLDALYESIARANPFQAIIQEFRNSLKGSNADHWMIQHPVQAQSGKEKILEIQVRVIGRIQGEAVVEGTLRDITQQVEMEAELRILATTDGLTGLYNRRHFMSLIETEPYMNAVIAVLDIDNFKQINDTYGHSVGDRVIQDLSVKMNRTFGSNSILSRVGGEEFCVVVERIVEDTAPLDKMQVRLNTLQSQLAQEPIQWGETTIRYTVSGGYALSGGQTSISQAYRHADGALYHAKRNGKNCFVAYEEMAPEINL